MTYLTFLLIFVVPPTVGLAAWLALHPLRGPGRRAVWSLFALALLALFYTTPWDNYLVWRGVWSYGADRVRGTLGWVPLEEYAFFLLQPLLTGLFLYALLGARGPTPAAGGRAAAPAGALPVLGWLGACLAGALMLLREPTTYLGLILVWAGPVLAGQWLWAGATVRRLGRTVVWAVALPTLYLWAADRVAIGLGIWSISPRYTTGLHILGLPIEEAAFFLLTNLLVVQGLLLFLFPPRAPETP